MSIEKVDIYKDFVQVIACFMSNNSIIIIILNKQLAKSSWFINTVQLTLQFIMTHDHTHKNDVLYYLSVGSELCTSSNYLHFIIIYVCVLLLVHFGPVVFIKLVSRLP